MLKRVVIINSKNYGKAVVRFDDCNSIQLVGPNNVGKSTLIYALNFLFIVDQKKMTFVDNKTGDKETIHHYLPSPLDSYIIFEIFKQRYYTILVKRNSEGDLEYYKFDQEYRDEFYIKQENGQSSILKFDDVYNRYVTQGVKITQFKSRSDFFNFVYQRGKLNDGVVWVENTVVSEGLSNNFSKVYRYLINSKLITNSTLKEALIVADNRDKEVLNFSQKNKNDILQLLKVNDEIKAINSIRSDFNEFREILNLYNAKTTLVAELVYQFNFLYPDTVLTIEKEQIEKTQEYDKLKIEMDEILTPAKETLDREIGQRTAELNQALEKQTETQKLLDEIATFEDLNFLVQSEDNLEKRRIEVESSIIRGQNYTVKQISSKIDQLKTSISKSEKQKDNYSEQLIHKISSNPKDLEILNSILSKDLLSSPTAKVKKNITKIGGLMKIFDGEIDLPKDLKGESIISVEEISEKILSEKKELSEFEKLLVVAQNAEKSEKELTEIKVELSVVKIKIAKIKSKPELETKLTNQKDGFITASENKEKIEKELKKLKEQISKKLIRIPELITAKSQLGQRIVTLREQKAVIEKINVIPVVSESSDGLIEIFRKVNVTNDERVDLKRNKDYIFDKLKARVKSNEASEAEFIKFIEEEIACLSDKQNSVETILQAISTQFANPAHTLIKRYGEFKEFIANQFNKKLTRTRISDIESLKIILNDNSRVIDDLKKISSIDQFTSQTSLEFDKTDNLKILNKYLDTGKKVEFEELFDLELLITKGGKEKKVDLKTQVESTGTDIMIRLVIIMSVINRLAVNDTNNKIAIAIDEIARVDGKNRLELFKFCNEHNFIPICTSTEETMLDGFDKYVMIFRPAKGKQANISEAHPNVITAEGQVLENEGARL